jgi:hypothetical protein
MPKPSKSAKASKPNRSGRRGLNLSLDGMSMDAAVEKMFSLSPETSRQIIAETSTSKAAKKRK